LYTTRNSYSICQRHSVDNIFHSIRSGGTGGHHAEYAIAGGTYNTNNNYLEVTADPNKIGNFGGTNYNFANWKTATGSAKDLNGTITFDAIGKVNTNPFIGAGTGVNLTATVADDKLGITRGIASWMGAFEGQNITTGTVSPLMYCAGTAVSVPYTIGGSGSFNAGNVFTAQLSDATGNFSTPTAIGTLASTTSGTIAATIPGTTPSGAGYLIRVVSSDPIITGSDNLANITIQAPTTFTVTSAAEGTTVDGTSLRWAITQANANCGHDTIVFNLGVGPSTIVLSSLLPNLTDNAGVTIDGFSNGANPGTANTTPVFNATVGTPMNPVYKVILGNTATVARGLVLASNNNIIKGLVLQDFGDGTVSPNDIAITITGNNNQVLGCYIGMNVTGTTKGTKTNIGIHITGATNLIGDGTATGANLISGINGSGQGILITGAAATGNRVRGNMIGLQKDGSTLVTGATQRWGISINSSSTNSATNNII